MMVVGMGYVLVGVGRWLLGDEEEGVFMRMVEVGGGGREEGREKVVNEVRD